MTKRTISDEDARNALTNKAATISEEDVKRLVGREKELNTKYDDVPGRFKRLINQVKLLFELIKDYWSGDYEEVPWTTIAMAVAAVIYFLSPIDFIPDFIPIVGYVDDAAVVALAIAAMQSDLKNYCKYKGYSQAQYF